MENALDFEKKSPFSAYLQADENAAFRYQGEKRPKSIRKRRREDAKKPLVTRMPVREARSISYKYQSIDENNHFKRVYALESITPLATLFWKKTRILRSEYAGVSLCTSSTRQEPRQMKKQIPQKT